MKGAIFVKGTVKALAPVFHSEPNPNKSKEEEGDSKTGHRKMKLCYGGATVDVPVVSSICVSHLFRRLLVEDLLEKAGLTEEDVSGLKKNASVLYQVLFSGGTLDSLKKEKEGGGAIRRSRKEAVVAALRAAGIGSKDEFADVFLPVRLFGAAIPWLNQQVPSAVGVGHLWPLTREVAELFKLTGSELQKLAPGAGRLPSCYELSAWSAYTRTDETAEGKKDKKEDPDARSIYSLEYVPAGMVFYHELTVVGKKEEERTKLCLSALRYLTEELLPRRPFLGGRVSRGYGRVEFRYFFPEGVTAEEYKKRVGEVAPKVREVIKGLLEASSAANGGDGGEGGDTLGNSPDSGAPA